MLYTGYASVMPLVQPLTPILFLFNNLLEARTPTLAPAPTATPTPQPSARALSPQPEFTSPGPTAPSPTTHP